MEKHTESELKVVKILSKILATPIEKEAKLAEAISNISITPYIFSEDMPKIMLITMPLEALIYTKLHSSEILPVLRKEFPKYMIQMRRTGDLPQAKVFTPVKAREEIIGDMVFPAAIAARVNEVESKDEMAQIVYLDSKSQCFSRQELLAIEKLLCTVCQQNFKVKIFGTGF